MDATSTKGFSFLKLPPELRLMVYEELFDDSWRDRFDSHNTPLSILRTNSIIASEAYPVLYKHSLHITLANVRDSEIQQNVNDALELCDLIRFPTVHIHFDSLFFGMKIDESVREDLDRMREEVDRIVVRAQKTCVVLQGDRCFSDEWSNLMDWSFRACDFPPSSPSNSWAVSHARYARGIITVVEEYERWGYEFFS